MLAALIGEEQALVLPREGRTGPVLEHGRAAHDEWPIVEVVEHRGQPLGDLRREPRILEQLDDEAIITPHPIDRHVFPIIDLVESVRLDEVQDAVRRDIPCAGKLEVAKQIGVFGRGRENLLRLEQSGRLPAEFALATGRVDDPRHQIVEIPHFDVLLRHIDEVELIEEHPPQQSYLDAGAKGEGEL